MSKKLYEILTPNGRKPVINESIRRIDYPLSHELVKSHEFMADGDGEDGRREIPAKQRKHWAASEDALKKAGFKKPEEVSDAHDKYLGHYAGDDGIPHAGDESGHKAAKKAGIPKEAHDLATREVWGYDDEDVARSHVHKEGLER